MLLLVFSSTTQAQSVKDTIYYDNYWRICEKPVARYYRLGELQLGQRWHFANDVKDFYIDGGLEMSGRYSSDGSKNGAFTFYHPNGKIKKQGSFVNDTMKGTWSYYDAKGELYFQLACQNNQTFTPLFIKNPGGDTLLKNGTGQFAFKLLDYPDVFPVANDYMVKGQCEGGKRMGAWTYDAFLGDNWRTVAIELYEDGTFRSGTFGYVGGGNQLRQPAFIVALSITKLLQTEAFTHDPVFGDYVSGTHAPQLTAFLQHGDVPVFASGAKKFEANVADYLTLCATAVGYFNWADSTLFWHGGSFRSAKLNKDAWLVGYCIQTDDPKFPKQSDLFPVERLKAYNAQISFNVYEDGTTSNVAVKGNFEKEILVHIAYYLSRLTGLSPLKEGGKAVAAKQNLYLFTKVNTATYRKHSYIVYRLLFSVKPQEQTDDKFEVADYAKAKFEADEE
ncbi:hypothetical protein GCM10023229_15340 [Flavisolibacter ginsenosidimutans]